jgi:hypothetical protein
MSNLNPERSHVWEKDTVASSEIVDQISIQKKYESLWQRSSDSFIVIDSGIWFERKPLGKNTLGEYM